MHAFNYSQSQWKHWLDFDKNILENCSSQTITFTGGLLTDMIIYVPEDTNTSTPPFVVELRTLPALLQEPIYASVQSLPELLQFYRKFEKTPSDDRYWRDN